MGMRTGYGWGIVLSVDAPAAAQWPLVVALDSTTVHKVDQHEIWFSILVRKLLRRASFVSTDDLRARLLAFIDSFNRTMAKPFKWTYTGRPLAA